MNTTLVNSMPAGKHRIAVAMSGGVDSSVTACLLARAGHEVVGFTAWTLDGPGKCCNDALVNAGRVCEQLGVAYDVVDLRALFSHYVLDYYNASYAQGLTPNPCVECNQYVKWEALVAYARSALQADYVATGHYARLDRQGPHPRLFRAVDTRKDQTYMLARVSPQDLAYALFPLGEMRKPDVVALARELGIPEADGKESQDVCFALNGHAAYIQGALGKRVGPVVDLDTGQVLGQHDGFYSFTVGQRKGLAVSANRPVYVVRVEAASNTVFVGDAHHLQASSLRVLDPRWLGGAPPALPFSTAVKIRYAAPMALASVCAGETAGALAVRVETPVSAVTPGQVCAFYDPEGIELLGGGYIERFLPQAAFEAHSGEAFPESACAR